MVSLAPSNTEIVSGLGALDLLVGVTSLCDFPPAVRQGRTIVGGWTDSDVVAVIRLRPDLVLTSTFLQTAITNQLRQRGLTVLHLNVRSLADVMASFQRIAGALHRPAAGRQLTKLFTMKLQQFTIQSPQPTRVYVEEWMHPPAVSGNWVPELVARAGGQSLAAADLPSRPVSLAEVQTFDPDLMVVSWCNTKAHPNLRALLDRPGWSTLRAVRLNRVYALDDSVLNRPGPRLLEGLQILRRLIEGVREA